jgi:hypothetical protein
VTRSADETCSPLSSMSTTQSRDLTEFWHPTGDVRPTERHAGGLLVRVVYGQFRLAPGVKEMLSSLGPREQPGSYLM